MVSTADLLIVNAGVFTANPAQPHAEAVAVRGSRIVFVGSNDDALAWAGPGARIVDAQRATLLPGFIDTHFHLTWGALRLDDLLLEQVHSLDQLSAALSAYAARHPHRPWISGHRLAYDVAGGRPLTRHDLDAIEPHRPVALMSADYHALWANTAALVQAGILQGGPSRNGSEIVMGADGTATGQLNERGAFDQVLERIPPVSAAEERELLRKALREIAAHGITSVHNMNGSRQELARYRQLEEAGELTLRVYIPYNVRPDTPLAALSTEAAPLREQYADGRVRCGAMKFYMDGVIESFTGFMLEPYANRPHSTGSALWTADQFSRFAVEADRLGFQIAVHAIGDAAVRRTLDGMEAARRINGLRDSRHRIEHIELLHPEDLPRFVELGVTASMQPLHASRPERDYFMYWTRCVDRRRWRHAFPWRDLRAAGVPLVFGSDWPIVSYDPYRGIEAAINRGAWAADAPSQALTLPETLTAYTRDAAWLEFQEDVKGQIRPGFLADLVLLDTDLFAVDPDDIPHIRPVLTLCDGRIVYEN